MEGEALAPFEGHELPLAGDRNGIHTAAITKNSDNSKKLKLRV
ncbi:hypothetical protein Y11_14671 [Yersinia enterocolitica subsp. palearctica Y11]|uniref:Uncharacterized protein n=1 Tax=Yersinia enterocolitica subsp. palearctica serotype O:3 (strain DSM 13030 / CIP 106945 / Y11) TaxID=930944 RepID=A0A0H3NZ05_YERE1|nr:hypothetical protein Y11_14671 [Yersinia enterocolitica subsp. palearctica Y11]CCO67652.1 FIG01220960: hypothetical protein [Yersinia enterocolitica IP 10393]